MFLVPLQYTEKKRKEILQTSNSLTINVTICYSTNSLTLNDQNLLIRLITITCYLNFSASEVTINLIWRYTDMFIIIINYFKLLTGGLTSITASNTAQRFPLWIQFNFLLTEPRVIPHILNQHQGTQLTKKHNTGRLHTS